MQTSSALRAVSACSKQARGFVTHPTSCSTTRLALAGFRQCSTLSFDCRSPASSRHENRLRSGHYGGRPTLVIGLQNRTYASKKKLHRELEYDSASEQTMQSLLDALDIFSEDELDMDVEYNSGVLTLTTADGTYVINKQPPNLQIWLSSPISGPWQFSFNAALQDWVDIRGSNKTLKSIIADEIKMVVDFQI